jgi:hypothetical protein
MHGPSSSSACLSSGSAASAAHRALCCRSKKDGLEVGDTVSFDVVLDNDSDGENIELATAELIAGATISVQLGCDSSICGSWAGVRGGSMFEPFGWILNDDPTYAYDISANFFASPIAPDPHVVLTANAPARIDAVGGNAIGAILGCRPDNRT